MQIGECSGRGTRQVWADPGGQWALYIHHAQVCEGYLRDDRKLLTDKAWK